MQCFNKRHYTKINLKSVKVKKRVDFPSISLEKFNYKLEIN